MKMLQIDPANEAVEAVLNPDRVWSALCVPPFKTKMDLLVDHDMRLMQDFCQPVPLRQAPTAKPTTGGMHP